MSIASINEKVLSVLYGTKFCLKTMISKTPPILRHSNINKAMIIGNGPSLNDTVKKSINKLKEYDCFMVNQSAEYDLFEIVKPLYYVLADELYFGDEVIEKSKAIVKAIKDKLNWTMYMLVPSYSKDSYIIRELKDNPNLKFIYYSSLSLDGFNYISKNSLYKYWNKNSICPLSQTVLNTALCIAVEMKYKEICIVGADTSWVELLEVDQKTNDFYLKDTHYYNSKRVLIASYDKSQSNIAHELSSIMKAFESYQILKEYAMFNGCKVYNASEYSLIDCIDRISL